MNESYQRALNEVTVLKKTLNNEKTSHQNTLQQLQTTQQIIDDMKQMLRNEQQKSKALTREVREKSLMIEQISQEYEDHISNIKELIERKDLEIKRYTQVKVTDYDMIRFRVISEVEAQHSQEIELLKKEIQKQEFLHNESMFDIKVLRDKNAKLEKDLEDLKEQTRTIEEEMASKHTIEMNKVFRQLEQEKYARKQTEKRMEREKEKYQQTIKKYHQELDALQTELISRTSGKQNRSSNLNGNNSSLIQLKESEFAQENQKLKRLLKTKNQELDELHRKHKSEVRELNKKIDELEKEINESRFQMKQLNIEINEAGNSSEQEAIQKCKRKFEKKERSLKEKYEYDLEIKDKEIRKLNKEIQNYKYTQIDDKPSGSFKQTLDKQNLMRLQRENNQLQAELKKTKLQLNQNASKKKEEELQNRQTRAVSVQNVKEKLQAANLQIVNLLKDKIALNDKIAKLTKQK